MSNTMNRSIRPSNISRYSNMITSPTVTLIATGTIIGLIPQVESVLEISKEASAWLEKPLVFIRFTILRLHELLMASFLDYACLAYELNLVDPNNMVVTIGIEDNNQIPYLEELSGDSDFILASRNDIQLISTIIEWLPFEQWDQQSE